MSIDPRRTQPFPTCECLNKECRCSRWPDYRNRWGLPVNGAEETYDQKVLGYGPIAYWPLWETSGVVAECLVNPAMNGTYSSDVSGWPPGAGIGDSNTAPLFDGATSYVDIMTAPLVAAWDAGGAEWSIMVWWKMYELATWTDGNVRSVVLGEDTFTDRAWAYKSGDNEFRGLWAGNTEQKIQNTNPITTVDWSCYTMTRSDAANELQWYRDGAWLQTDVIGNAWNSATPWAEITIGARAGIRFWHGWIARLAMWDRALPPAEVLALATV